MTLVKLGSHLLCAAEQFQTIAEDAKKGCPISRVLSSVPITMTAKLL